MYIRPCSCPFALEQCPGYKTLCTTLSGKPWESIPKDVSLPHDFVSLKSLLTPNQLQMPNLVPPITTVKQALDYRSKLQALEPNVDFLMSLYLHESMTVETIIEAKRAGISGVKR